MSLLDAKISVEGNGLVPSSKRNRKRLRNIQNQVMLEKYRYTSFSG